MAGNRKFPFNRGWNDTASGTRSLYWEGKTEIGVFLTTVIFCTCFVITSIITRAALPRLRQARITGIDMHKPNKPEIPEMGGMFFVIGFAVGMGMAIAFNTFLERFLSVDLIIVLAALSAVLMAALIGIIDDLINVRQSVKAIVPIICSLPLVAVSAGETTMYIIGLGQVDFGIYYSIILVPLGFTGAVNAVNMLSGFDGLTPGMGIVAMASLAVVAFRNEETAALLILIIAIAALLATLYYNWHPAKVFVGDVGTLSIGAIIASAVIIGNFELAGVIIIIPFMLDFVIKTKNRFPSVGWWGIYRGGKLYCPESGPVGIGQLVLKVTGGTSEKNVTMILMSLEVICGAVAIWLFW